MGIACYFVCETYLTLIQVLQFTFWEKRIQTDKKNKNNKKAKPSEKLHGENQLSKKFYVPKIKKSL